MRPEFLPAALQFKLVQSLFNSKMSSIFILNRRATLKASGRLGSYFSVSIALTVWRETSSLSARSDCDHSFAARSSRRRFFIYTSATKKIIQSHNKSTSCKMPNLDENTVRPQQRQTHNSNRYNL